MIVRTWSARADGLGAESYSRYFAGTLLPELRTLPGFAGAYLLRRDLDEDGLVELTTHTLWESLDAIRGFAGEDISRSIVEPEAQAMLLEFDRAAVHRTVVVDAAPADLSRALTGLSRVLAGRNGHTGHLAGNFA
jgi:heme-degrading monooxygenase HmoA